MSDTYILDENTVQHYYDFYFGISLKEHSRKNYSNETHINYDDITKTNNPQLILDFAIVFNNSVKLTYKYLKNNLTHKTDFILEKKNNPSLDADETDLLEVMINFIKYWLTIIKNEATKINPDEVTNDFKITINGDPTSYGPFNTLTKRYEFAIEIMTRLLKNFESCIQPEPEPAPIEVKIESCTPAPTGSATSGGTNQQPHHKTNKKNYKNDRITKKKRQTTTYLTSL